MPKKEILKFNYFVPILESVLNEKNGEFSIRGIAINETTTRNGHIFRAEELEKSAKTLIGKPLLKDHNAVVDNIVGKVVDAKYSRVAKNVEFTARVMDAKMQEMISDGRISNVSVGAWPEDVEETDEGLVVKGIDFLELSLVAIPADPNAAMSKAGFDRDFGMVICEAFESSKFQKDHEKQLIKTMMSIAEQESTTVQTLIFSKDKFSQEEATSWASDHDFRADKVDETEDSFRLRQRDPSDFKENSFRTIELSSGVKAVIGKLKESLEDSKKKMEESKMEIQTQDSNAVLADAVKQLAEQIAQLKAGKVAEMPMPKDEDELKMVCKKMMGEESAKEIGTLKETIKALEEKLASKEASKDETKGIVAAEAVGEENSQASHEFVIEGSQARGASLWRMPGPHGELSPSK